jgi:hypothetical protein
MGSNSDAVRRAWVKRRERYGDSGVRNPETQKRGGWNAPERRRESAMSADAVDPHATSTGKPSTRD